ncbi:MAG: PilN domain-containing protein, partial [Vicinamibacterales bacterium]
VQMQAFEQRKAELQQRVTLIEQLRAEQTGPVHILDQVSLALPPTLWLTEMRQAGAGGAEILIEGRALSLNGLSDFIANLERSGYFQRSVEIVSTTTDMGGGPQGEVIRFQIKAVFKNPAAAAAEQTGQKPSSD